MFDTHSNILFMEQIQLNSALNIPTGAESQEQTNLTLHFLRFHPVFWARLFHGQFCSFFSWQKGILQTEVVGHVHTSAWTMKRDKAFQFGRDSLLNMQSTSMKPMLKVGLNRAKSYVNSSALSKSLRPPSAKICQTTCPIFNGPFTFVSWLRTAFPPTCHPSISMHLLRANFVGTYIPTTDSVGTKHPQWKAETIHLAPKRWLHDMWCHFWNR